MKKHPCIQSAVVALALATTAMTCQADVVAIMGPQADLISRGQLADIYLGRNFDFKPLNLPADSPVYAEFYRRATGRDVAQIKVIWSRIVYTGKGRSPLVLPDATAVKKAVIADPEAIGYIDSADVDSSVKVVVVFE